MLPKILVTNLTATYELMSLVARGTVFFHGAISRSVWMTKVKQADTDLSFDAFLGAPKTDGRFN
jgi:hypothetical protein